MDAAIRLLSDLVALPSINPMGRTTLTSDHLEGRMSDYLEAWFRNLGVPVVRESILPGRDNVIARYESPHSGRTVLFDVHQDTVPVEGMTIEPFQPIIRAGRLYGRGSCDIKGGMAAMMTAFARLVRERPPGAASVVLACTVDEEFTHVGSSRLAQQLDGIDVAIVAEPTRLDIVDCHKGAIRWKIRTNGIACHSSTPDLGDNAIYRMARVLGALEDHAADLARSDPDSILGSPSLSVGRIDGGVSVNVVPDRCEVEIDRRIIPGEHPGRCRERVHEAVLARLGSHDGVEFLPPWVIMPSLVARDRQNNPWLTRMAQAIHRVTHRQPEILGVPYGTDAGPLGETGLPCFVLGPGDIAQAHTKDEWVEVDQILQGAEIYFEIACELGQH